MTDGTRRTRAGRIRLVPVDDRQAHEERIESMKNHPTATNSRAHLTPIEGGGGALEED